MRSLAIVPARGGSKRIRQKNITDFCGKPLMAHSIEAAHESQLFQVIHVSTNCEQIRTIGAALHANTEFLRPENLSDDQTGIVPVLRWVVREFERRGQIFNDICMLMPTAPLINSADLRTAYDIFKSREARHPVVAVASYPVPIEWAYTADPADLLTRSYPDQMTNVRSQDLGVKYYDAGAFAFFNTRQLLDEHHDLGSHLVGYHLPRHRVADIDNPEDLEFAKILYRGSR